MALECDTGTENKTPMMFTQQHHLLDEKFRAILLQA